MSESSAEHTPSPEQIVEELRRASVADLLATTCSLVASLGYGKLSPEARDLEQAQLAIEALKALVPLLRDAERGDVQEAIANLQLAYVQAVMPPPSPGEAPGAAPGDPPPAT